MLILGWALLLAPQDTFSIPRAQKDAYAKHVPECERAAAQIDTDPQAAVDTLDAILENAQVEKRECRIRWEVAPGTFTRYYDFFPYQYRGRAQIRLAEKTLPKDRERAKAILERAVRDFQTSLDRGIKSSEALLADAKKRLAAASDAPRPNTGDPAADAAKKALAEFEADWQKAIDGGRFVDVQTLIDSPKGKALTEARRKLFSEDTQEKCRLHVDAAAQRFLRNLKSVGTPRQLEIMAPASFDREFSLPDRAQLLASALLPEYLWCVEAALTLKAFRDKKEVVEPFLGLALKAVPAAGKSDFGGFESVERLAYEILDQQISQRADASRAAPADRRSQLRQEAEKHRDRWKVFEGDVRKAAQGNAAFLQRVPARDFTAHLDRFPVDRSAGAELLAALRKSAEAADPDRALVALQSRTSELHADWDRLSVESKLEILRYEIIIGALRGFLSGEVPDQVASALRATGAEYRTLGGKADELRFGPKVLQVFKALTK